MKLIILVTLLSCAILGNAFKDEETKRMLGEWVMEEISRRTNTEMTLDRVISSSTQKRYYAVGADKKIELGLDMMARRRDGTLVQCQATLGIPEDIGKSNMESYDCREADDGQFYKRSGETRCTQQEMENIADAALAKINENVDENNELQKSGIDMLPMDIPGLDFTQGHFTFKRVKSCTKAGNEIMLELDATQDGIDETCTVKLIQHGDSYSVAKNQCQGQN